ncbi:four helix bundle protein [Candidatus Falkowbacteria bacterium]|nr:four helix bundle protein [Candidatus Falkowbacteria bacterium]
MKTYKELIVWQKAMELVIEVYKLTDQFPKSEIYGLTSQMRRSAVSIPSNIAEGRRRGSKGSFRNFLLISFGSGAELETQIEIARSLPQLGILDYNLAESLLDEVMRILNTIIKNLST